MSMYDRDQFLALLRIYSDKPATNELNFDFNKHANHIVNFIINEEIPSTFSIGIDGEWGDGKTTLLNMIKILLEKNNMTVIKFDAWKHEKINVVAALYQKIAQKLQKNHGAKKIIEDIGTIIADEALRSYSGISLIRMKKQYEKLTRVIETIPKQLSDLMGNNKLIILIDDLDRCNVDNMLEILESVKMFLSVDNVIFIIAADMLKLEQAWELRYNSKLGAITGRQHLEKMFQLKLSISSKSKELFEDYVRSLLPLEKEEIWDIIDHVDLNPRAIKRILNLVYFVIFDISIPGKTNEEININFNKYLKTLLIWISLILHHTYLARKIIRTPSYLIQASAICSDQEYLSNLKKSFKDSNKLPHDYRNCPAPLFEILEHIANADEPAYRLIRRYAKIWDIEFSERLLEGVNWSNNYKYYTRVLRKIIDDAGLLGV